MNARSKLNEQQIEDVALEWLRNPGWKYAYGPDIEPLKPASERETFFNAHLADSPKTSSWFACEAMGT